MGVIEDLISVLHMHIRLPLILDSKYGQDGGINGASFGYGYFLTSF